MRKCRIVEIVVVVVVVAIVVVVVEVAIVVVAIVVAIVVVVVEVAIVVVAIVVAIEASNSGPTRSVRYHSPCQPRGRNRGRGRRAWSGCRWTVKKP